MYKIQGMIHIKASRTAFPNVFHFYPGNLNVSYSIKPYSLLPNGGYFLNIDEKNLINSSLFLASKVRDLLVFVKK